MIIDSIENIDNYCEISDEIKNFLKSLSDKSEVGHYEISKGAYANIDIYDTKTVEKCRFEAHKRFIDIQMLLSGEECIDCIEVNKLNISEEYDLDRDVMFFDSTGLPVDSTMLNPFKFIMIYPHEAHRPQMSIGDSSKTVKKVVVKLPV